MDVNVWPVLVSAVAAFVLSGTWYAGFGDALSRLSPAYADDGGPAGSTVVVELARNVVVAVVVAVLVGQIDPGGWIGAAGLSAILWVGLPVVLLAGSVFHEKVPARLAAIHAGDWLVKLLIITLIVGLWR